MTAEQSRRARERHDRVRAFTVKSTDIAKCPTHNLAPKHWREDGTCLHTGPRIDLLVSGGGSLYEVHAVSPEGRAWIEQSVSSEGYNPGWPERVHVEHRYIRDIVQGATADGLVVK